MSNPEPDPTTEPEGGLDVEAEQERLDELGQRIDRTHRETDQEVSERDKLGDWMPDSGPQDAPTELQENRPDL